ncbi:uncharacterized protein LOC141848794 [Brevipalpus obovatus]|uniref:uncharacterized protein LOC141848794 n=1 Tax=Brevipalpus obovatus TaxID=246614 RepID=UPI003D9F1770
MSLSQQSQSLENNGKRFVFTGVITEEQKARCREQVRWWYENFADDEQRATFKRISNVLLSSNRTKALRDYKEASEYHILMFLKDEFVFVSYSDLVAFFSETDFNCPVCHTKLASFVPQNEVGEMALELVSARHLYHMAAGYCPMIILQPTLGRYYGEPTNNKLPDDFELEYDPELSLEYNASG